MIDDEDSDCDEDSAERLLETVKSTVPSVVPPPSKGSDPDSERAAKKRQAAVVDAWNRMAEKMVCVVRTIQKNEEAMVRWHRTMKRMVISVWIAMACGLLGAFYLAVQAENAINNLHRQTVGLMSKMAGDQTATLTAVSKLTEAMGLKLEAETKMDPATDREAATAALDAQQAALEAKKYVTDSPIEKADADRKIRKVEAKRDKEAKDRKEQLELPRYDEEELANDKPLPAEDD